MVFVQGGEFQMGNDKGYLMERPAHTVTVSDFYIDKFEVTVAQYREFCKATRRKMPSPPPWGWQDNYPIIKVTWEDANAYAAWAGKRLPTEAEWEYAARGGNRREMYMYSGSDEIDKVAWYASNSGGKTHPVGKKSPNALGIYDMTGNAAEWCAEWYGGNYYRMSPSQDPPGPPVGIDRVIRGGSFLGDQDDCRVTKRSSALPNRVSRRNGFRCVWQPKGK
jgi:formylglycine-generating enzyme required for sulfatase activity